MGENEENPVVFGYLGSPWPGPKEIYKPFNSMQFFVLSLPRPQPDRRLVVQQIFKEILDSRKILNHFKLNHVVCLQYF